MLSDKVGFKGDDIMFSSNATPDQDFILAAKLGAIINLDDITHIEVLDKLVDFPETISFRFNRANLKYPKRETSWIRPRTLNTA